MSEEILRHHQAVWKHKPILRTLYTQWYEELSSYLRPGRTLELGGGSGNLKEFARQVVCTDIVRLPWIDLVADAQSLPFEASSYANIVLFDVLHHIENVRLFFDESLRVLKPGGRLAVMDPYISLASWPIYHFLHPEPVDLRRDPLCVLPPDKARRPFDANQAVATILFERSYQSFRRQYPMFNKLIHRRLAFFAYPLSGGFERPSLIPSFLLDSILSMERRLRFFERLLAFRILIVLEKST